MSLKVRPVKFIANAPGSQVFSGASVVVDLIDSLGHPAWDTDGSFVIPKRRVATLDVNGEAVIPLWPNSRGVRNTMYLVRFESPYGELTIKIRVPDGDEEITLRAEDLIQIPTNIPAGSALGQTLLNQMQVLRSEVEQFSDRLADVIGGGLIPIPYTLTNVSSFLAEHSRSYHPSILLLDSQGNAVDTDVHYAEGQVTLVFAQPFTGQLYLN